MDKKKKQLIITCALLVVMAVMMARAFFPGAKKGGARKAPASVAAGGGIDTTVMTTNMTFLAMLRQNEAARVLQEAHWEKPWGRDPFALSRSKSVSDEFTDSFVLSGIVWDEKMPVAIIDQKVMKTGDTIDDCSVKEIHRSTVMMVCGGKPLELHLFRTPEPPAPAGDKQAQP